MQNPVARWHICQGSINSVAFSTEGTYIATVGRDGIVLNPTVSHCSFAFFISSSSCLYLLGTSTGFDHQTDVGYLRVFDYNNEQLICGGKSYYGALLCCAWR